MKKTYEFEDLDCANCAMKMQEAILKIPGVQNCEVSFIKQKMTIEADDAEFDKIVKLAVKTIAKVEPDCTVLL
jgi:copper chaperone CopZ